MPVRQLLCATPAYLAHRGKPQHPTDLATHDCLYLGETTSDANWSFRRDAEHHTVPVQGRYVCNHSEVRLEGMLDGYGIAVLPHFIAASALANGSAVAVLPDWEFVGAYQGSAWLLNTPNTRLTPKCRVLIDYLLAALKDQ